MDALPIGRHALKGDAINHPTPHRSCTDAAGGQREGQQETYYRHLIEQVEEHAIFILDPEGRVATWNRGAERVLGYREEEVLGQHAAMLFTAEDQRQGVPERELETALQRGRAADDRWHRRKDGSHFWANGVLTALYNDDGSLSGFGKILRDLTRWRLAQEEREQLLSALAVLNETLETRVLERTQELLEALTKLRRSERRFESAFHAGPVAACITTLEGVFLEVNTSFLQLTGYTEAEVLGRSDLELHMWASQGDQEALARAEAAGGSFRELGLKIQTKTGEVRDILVSGEHIALGDGTSDDKDEPKDEAHGKLKLFYDISERKRTEEQLYGAIQEVMSDTAWFSRQVMERLARVRTGGENPAPLAELTSREQQVLEHLARGASNAQIAESLGLAPQTVRNYIAVIYDKLGVHSRAEAVVWARERGILGP